MRAAAAVPIVLAVLCGEAQGDTTRAEELLDEAVELGKSGDLAGAIAKAKQSDALSPSWLARCNIAVAYVRLDRPHQAHLHFSICMERAAADGVETADEARQKAADQVEKLERAMRAADYSPITVTAQPRGAIVGVSEFPPDETFSPRVIWLPPGQHTFTARADEYVEASETVTVAASTPATVTLTLEPIEVADPEPAPDPTGDVVVPPPDEISDRVAVPLAPEGPGDHPARTRGKLPWITLGVGGAAMSVGAVLHIAAVGTRGDIEDLAPVGPGMPHPDLADAESRYGLQRASAIGFYAVGAVSLGLSAWLFSRASGSHAATTTAGIAPSSTGGSVWVRWTL